jgi:DNA polymerase-1
MISNKKRLVVIDSNALIHRAFHALPPLTSPKKELVNAVYGFLLVFLKALKELYPDYIAATFDLPGPTFRKEIYEQYKAKRVKAPDELYAQIPIVKKILQAFDVQIFEKQGFEADDVIGTIAKLAKRKQISPEIETIIITGDSDALRLVDANTKVYTLKKGLSDTIIYDEQLVKEKYEGLNPEQLTDYRALRGDPSDNIPGVTGIGPKTAIDLLKKFDSLENIYSAIEKDSDDSRILPRVRDRLIAYKEQALFSRALAEINTDVPIDFNLEQCKSSALDKEKIIKIFQEFGFYSLIKRLPESKQTKLGDF